MTNRTVPAAAEGMPSITRREALRTLGAGAATGALAGGVVIFATPATEAASTDAMIGILAWYRKVEQEGDLLSFGDDDTAAEAFRIERIEPIRQMIVEDCPAVTTNEGARLALSTALTHGVFICPFTHTLVREALRYLDGRA